MAAAGSPQTVDEYFAAQPADARERLEALRERLLAVVPDAVQEIRYGMASFRVAPGRHLYLANWKAHIGVYPIYVGDAAFEAVVGRYRGGKTKDTIQLAHARPLPDEVVTAILDRVARDLAG